MPQFFTRAFLFLVLCFYGLVSGLVSKDFSECSEFFYHGIPPQGIIGGNYQPICQKVLNKNKYYFATLYDRTLHAALYSAYKVSSTKDKEGSRPDEDWFYEPQLTDMNKSPEMKPIQGDKIEITSQASLRDYKGSIYTKGHLAPSLHQETLDGKKATFTLTNMLPQRGDSNSGPWAEWEREVVKRKMFCTGDMYVITGGIPFDPKRYMNDKVSIPEYMWSAYCCTAYGNNAPPNTFPTGAAVGRNDPNSGEGIVSKIIRQNQLYYGYDVKQMSLQDLTKILNNKLNVAITLFQGDCK